MLDRVMDVDWMVTDTQVEALMLECNLIKKHHPRYNVRLRDDKHYPYLCVTTSEPFPRVLVARRVKQDGNRYFGPYADSSAMRESMRLIRKVFRIRGCNKQLTPSTPLLTKGGVGGGLDRPCLNFHMGQCDSPCSGRISREEYAELVRDTCLFLEGRQESLAEGLEKAMHAASDRLEFERAARLRDQLDSVRKVVEKQKVISTRSVDQDIISVGRDGGASCVQLFFVRSGKLVGQGNFFLEGILDESPESSLDEFIKQYYRDATYVPREILISYDPPDKALLEDWLSMKRGSRVSLVHPKRGAKRRLVELAAENATLIAKRETSIREGDEEEAARDLEALSEALNLPEPPSRIEAYDISNIQGREAVGSMVVFEDGMPAKSQYRRFKIRTVEQSDDYAMIREVLRRRLAHGSGDPKFASLPDLILIDGGKGQLSAALEALRGDGVMGRHGDTAKAPSPLEGEGWGEGEIGVHPRSSEVDSESAIRNPKSEIGESSVPPWFDIPVVALAKRLEEIYVPGSEVPIVLERSDRALRLLQRIRDEAHRFALGYHHKLRQKSARKSVLDSIPGIGAQRRKALIRRFGSVAGVKRASLEDLLSVPGLTRPLAEKIHEHLHAE
jgi:excinuclease ABC subunit C